MSSLDTTANANAASSCFVPLRWWPAAACVASMIAMRILPRIVESVSPSVLMFAFIGPAVIGLVILVWWVLASRASWNEKVIGLFATFGIGLVATLLSHYTMRDMGLMIYIIPYGLAAFAIPLVLLAGRPQLRMPVALVGAVIGFGYCDLLKLGGFSFTLGADLSWRWEMSAEENYLKNRSRNSEVESGGFEEPAITLTSPPWPSFRGRNRDARVTGVEIDEDWTKTPPKLIWHSKIGPGWSSFISAGNCLFTQEQRGENEAVVCLDCETGQTIWEYEYVSRFWETVAGAGPRATPSIADSKLFAMGANGNLICLDARMGEKIWDRDLKVDANRKSPMWGFASSPLVTEGVVIVHAGGAGDKGLFAYDVSTGEIFWSTASGDHSYSSAQLASFDGVTGVLMETSAGLQFVNPRDGDEIWRFDSPIQNYRALQPLVIGNSVLIASGQSEGAKKLSVTRNGTSWDIKLEWESRDMKSDFNDFVAHNGKLFGFDGNIFACVDLATGKRQWKKGRYGNGQVLLLGDADQMLITSETGELVLVKTDPDKLVELARIQAIEGKTWNHSVIVDNKIYIRNAQEAACYELPTR